MSYQYVSINSVFSKLIRHGVDTFSENDVVEWCGEALEFIDAIRSYEDCIAFIEIKNHQGQLPKWLHSITQVAKNNSPNYKQCTPLEVCEEVECCRACIGSIGDQSCACPSSDAVWLDCNGQPIVAYDLAYYRPYFDLKVEYEGWSNSRYYKEKFTPIRLANHTFFNSVVEPECNDLYMGSTDQYTIIQGKYIRTSFKCGQICVSYKKQLTDDSGYPMIPDDISYKTAITKYIQYMIADKDFQGGREGAKGRLDKYEADWQWYCGQASNNDKMISGIDEYENLLTQRTTLIPNNKKYYGFFGNLSNLEGQFSSGDRLEKYPNTFNSENMYHTPVPSNNICGVSTNVIPPIKTVTGDKLVTTVVSGSNVYTWTDARYAGFKIEVFANPFNRYLAPGEYKVLITGGVEIYVGGPYGLVDIFKMIPNGLLNK